MKLEVGMYIRINDFISKIDYIKKSKNGNEYIQFKEPNGMIAHINSKLIEKASHNIIDLIEVGDYVNGELVTDITGEYIRIGDVSHNKSWLSNNIKTILTKEQFEDNCFRIGD